MPRLLYQEPDPLIVLSPAPGSEIPRALLYATARGRFNRQAWLASSGMTPLLQAVHSIPLCARLSHFQRNSLPVKQQPSAIGTPASTARSPSAGA